jgi:hypothetical protein
LREEKQANKDFNPSYSIGSLNDVLDATFDSTTLEDGDVISSSISSN